MINRKIIGIKIAIAKFLLAILELIIEKLRKIKENDKKER